MRPEPEPRSHERGYIHIITTMPKRFQSAAFDLEFQSISARIRKPMMAIVPLDWIEAELVVRETDPIYDDLIEIDTPLLNPATDEVISPLPKDMCDAILDLYLLFCLPGHRPWETCVIRLDRTSSGKRIFRTRFFYDDTYPSP